jgi:hypothetical protein
MSTAPRPTAYDISVCIHTGEVVEEPFDLLGAGARVKPLRRFADGALRSGLVRFPAGWRGASAFKAGAALQIYLRAGVIELGGQRLAEGAFVVVPRGGVLPALASAEGAEAILILDDPAALVPAADGNGALIIEDVFAVAPIVPVINGRALSGFERRVLWEDPETGADTRLLRIPPHFNGVGGPNFHPVEEEIFCLDGDIAPDDKTPMRAGSFLWNPKLAVHGFHEHTIGGCVLLEWHDGLWAIHNYAGDLAGV